ncbi:MAG: NUDIX domain-containing protein, partial [Planctomycetaceae bacterium]
ALRECLEETGLEVRGVRLLLRQSFAYPHGEVDLHFWLCRPARPDAVPGECRGFRWCPVSELPERQFPEGNAEVIRMRSEPTRASSGAA